MNLNSKVEIPRREFLRTAARNTLIGGLGALGVFLVVKNKICLRGGVCRNCSVYEKCELPQKEKLR